jgi:4-carboxymuconolactone decarboxylase
MPPIPAEKMTDAQRKAVEEFRAARGGGVSGPFVPLLRSPEVMNRARAMGDYLRFKSVLPPRLSEFAILITARHWTQNYEWSAHHQLALKGGLRDDIARAVAEGRRPERMAEDEEILYNFTIELQQNKSVSDATYARALAAFGEQGVIDIVGISGYYTFLAMVLNTARTPLPQGSTPGLAPFPR